MWPRRSWSAPPTNGAPRAPPSAGTPGRAFPPLTWAFVSRGPVLSGPARDDPIHGCSVSAESRVQTSESRVGESRVRSPESWPERRWSSSPAAAPLERRSMLDLLTHSPWTPALVQGAAGALALAAALGWRRKTLGVGSASPPSDRGARVPAAPASDRAAPAGVQASSPGRTSGESRSRPRIVMSAAEQMRDFLTFMIVEGWAGKYSGAQWAKHYLDWAAERSIAPLPKSIFLTLLGKHSLIRKSRDRLKDRATGRVRKTGEKRTPAREYFYTLTEPAPPVCERDAAVAMRRRAALRQAEQATFVTADDAAFATRRIAA